MPELPDVESFRAVLSSCAGGRTIRRVEVYDTGVLHEVSERRLRHDLTGRTFQEPERHGKWLIAGTDGPTVLLHFGMTGMLVCRDRGEGLHPHDRLAFEMDSGCRLRYRDQRKLKGLWLADDSGVAKLLRTQGPDAADIGRDDFEALLSGRRGGIKSLLTDQSRLAGLGNLLADEILWRARLAPSHIAGEIDEDRRRRLYTEMRRTLRSAIGAGRVPARASWLTGHRDIPARHGDSREGRCPRCGTALRHGRVAGRGTVWCPHCQPD
ncbi:Fpg/Nei family DNA glycosylase [Streptomyces tsukubensis]|uniref:Formamidopyrimidine-DNA glycosylase n=1 Tax=Streptomyces tsukubensis TaxID=83656 RepID=A0A1V4AGA8_9ACTN|nr:DNA-formamidopyrimidine glycosylase family protein [Streptomyces tsukubensis]OON82695.1 formamidopyrimidine-DNA glycosylase [Streptomyces tsukubensis]QFR92131.1 Fpg/Nei family DNA glycosylase [Streptomyces tsukubensis]